MTLRLIRVSLLLAPLLLSAAPSPAAEFTVMYYNLCNYFGESDAGQKPKKESSKKSIAAMITQSAPDVLLLAEMGGAKTLDEFKEMLAGAGCGFKYSNMVQGEDDARHLAILSKSEPAEFNARTDLFYKIKPKNSETGHLFSERVQRGFLHAVFAVGGPYRIHIVGAHLKSRLFNPKYNQTDMRRYEARLLRYLLDGILEKEKGANIIVLGDMNDTFDTDPLSFIRNGNKADAEKLYDLRPLDQFGMAWTHWQSDDDVYGRIDYAFASPGLLPEIDFARSSIRHIPDLWMFASDHRPLFITVNAGERPPMPPEKISELFGKDAIYRAPGR